MCGIAGVISPQIASENREKIVRGMTDALAHRGPDDFGYWFDTKSGIGLGHRRLSILDLSPLGHQPMASRSGRFLITFNGELYNFHKIRASLESIGYSFHSQSDTEILLAVVEEWGVSAALQKFTGMFAFGLWDRESETLYLARDRIGVKPLYYGSLDGCFAFASELKAFQAVWKNTPAIDRRAFDFYIRYGYVPAPLSIFNGIQKLLPGQILTYRLKDHSVSTESYWRLPEPEGVHQGEEAIDRLEKILERSVKDHMISDAPIGAFLSGGIDSSLVVALMQKGETRPVRTFTIGFEEQDYNEAPFAKRVASHLGTDHTELYVSSADALSVVPKLSGMYDEPFGDASQIPTYLVSQLASRTVKVVLSGDGGDELFAGYPRYRYGAWANVVRSSVPSLIRGPLGKMIQRAGVDPRLRRMGYILRLQSFHEIHLNFISLWKDDDELAALGVNPKETLDCIRPWCKSENAVETMTHMDLQTYLVDDLLTKVDRASMAQGLEVRVPILDPSVVEEAFHLSVAEKIGMGRGKIALRKILYRYVPQGLVDRPKRGFELPIRHWLRGPLRDWAESLLSKSRLRQEGYFQSAPLRAIWDEHLSGRRNHEFRLWPILMFQSWLEAMSKQN